MDKAELLFIEITKNAIELKPNYFVGKEGWLFGWNGK